MSGVPIQVKFVTQIRDGARKETISFDTNGLYYEKGQGKYVTFEEPNEQGKVNTIVKIQEDHVRIMRSGALSMRQLHVKGEETSGSYESMMGTFSLQTKTDNILFQWSDKTKKGQLFLTYTLFLNGSDAGRYTITITFKEETK